LLEAASDEERQNYQLGSQDVYWKDIDDGLALTAMLSGRYRETTKEYKAYLRKLIAERKAKVPST